MPNSSEHMPVEVETEVGELISELRAAGWTVLGSRYDAKVFGNWYVDLSRGRRTIRLMKDRSQYMTGEPITKEMRDAGLWRAFDDLQEFQHAIIKWVA